MIMPAATLRQLSIDEMITQSTAIVRGTVQAAKSERRGSVVYTHYRVAVAEQWKGTRASAADFVVPGGVAGGLQQSFAGAPAFAAGQQYILFLWTSRSGLTHVIGLSQGVFKVLPDDAGGNDAVRAELEGRILDAAGKSIPPAAIRMRVRDLRARVLSGGAAQQ